jgi:hypothetical protein
MADIEVCSVYCVSANVRKSGVTRALCVRGTVTSLRLTPAKAFNATWPLGKSSPRHVFFPPPSFLSPRIVRLFCASVVCDFLSYLILKGKKQRIHKITREKKKMYITLNDDAAPYDSDRYAFINYEETRNSSVKV